MIAVDNNVHLNANLRSPSRVERQDEVESTERREGVGEDAPDLPLGPYCDTTVTTNKDLGITCGKLRGMKCSWLETILRKSICKPQRAACSPASPSPWILQKRAFCTEEANIRILIRVLCFHD